MRAAEIHPANRAPLNLQFCLDCVVCAHVMSHLFALRVCVHKFALLETIQTEKVRGLSWVVSVFIGIEYQKTVLTSKS